MSADLPGDLQPQGEIFITGVESEEVEEINDAYNDILQELGKIQTLHTFEFDYLLFIGYSKTTEDDFDEIMPSCLPLLVIDYLVFKCFNSRFQFT